MCTLITPCASVTTGFEASQPVSKSVDYLQNGVNDCELVHIHMICVFKAVHNQQPY